MTLDEYLRSAGPLTESERELVIKAWNAAYEEFIHPTQTYPIVQPDQPGQPGLFPDPDKVILRKAICLYCGHNTPYIAGNEKSQAEAWKNLLEHDLTCDKNPLVQKIRKLEIQVNAEKVAYCVYCNLAIPFDPWDRESAELAMAAMKAHHQHCKDNPLVQKIKAFEAEMWDLRKGI